MLGKGPLTVAVEVGGGGVSGVAPLPGGVAPLPGGVAPLPSGVAFFCGGVTSNTGGVLPGPVGTSPSLQVVEDPLPGVMSFLFPFVLLVCGGLGLLT